MLGLMQDVPLTVDRILDHAAAWHGARELVSRDAGGHVTRSTYAQVHADAKRVSNALADAGIGFGDRVATLAWNSARHLAAWYGACGMGAVLHTLNPRLHLEQIAYIANHAGDRLLIADPACADLVAQLLPQVPSIERVIFFCDRASLPETAYPATAFDDWIAGYPADYRWGGFDERTACGLCYTSGTTGNPKGVLYSHRSNSIHALMTLQRDALGLCARDSVLLVVPMYHANAWGVVYSAPAHLAATLKSGVMDASPPETVRDVIVGGSICPPEVAAQFGSPEWPLSRDEHLAKALGCLEFAGLGASHAALAAAVETLACAPDALALLESTGVLG